MLSYNGIYLVSTEKLPFPFNKRRDGNFYAKGNLDTLKVARLSGYKLDKSVTLFQEQLLKDLKKFKLSKSVSDAPSILYDHQKIAYELVVNNLRGALFMEQGTGKTLPTLLAMDHLFKTKQVKRILVLAPKRVIDEWIRQHDNFNIATPIYNLRETKEVNNGINVLNYAMVWRKGYTDFDMVVLDESHKIKNSGTKINKFLVSNMDKSQRRFLLTGTAGDNPTDYFGQYKFMDNRMFGESQGAFKEIFTWYDQQTGAVWGIKKSMKDKFWGRVHALSYWVRKEECLDLPEQVDEFEYVELPKKILKQMKQIETDNITYLDNGQAIIADNSLVVTIKLRQMIQGTVEGNHIHNEKLKAVKDMVIDKPVIIFTVFTQDVHDLLTIFPDASVITGWRDDLDRWLNGETQVLIANYTSANAGLNLQRASLMIFYSLTWSYTVYDQAKARIHRIGQTNKCTYVHLIAKNTLDERVLTALKKKEDFVVEGVNHERKLFTEQSNKMVK